MNKYTNRAKIISNLKSITKGRNVIYISPANSFSHEIAKSVIFYLLKKGYSLDSAIYLTETIANDIKGIESEISKQVKLNKLKPKKNKNLILTEPVIGNDKVDLILADDLACIEIDYKHKTGKSKIKRLEDKGFRVKIVSFI